MFDRIPLESHLALDSCFWGDFWILIQFLYCLWVCSNFLSLPVSVLVVYMFLGICWFLPDCPIYWHIIAHNIILLLFVFLQCLLWYLLFHHDFISLLNIGLSKFSTSSCFSFGSLYVSRNLSISSRLPILLAYNCS